MAGTQPGTGGGKMLRAVGRAAGDGAGGMPDPIRPATATSRWPATAAPPPRVISLPPSSSSNASSSLHSSVPLDDGVVVQQPSSSPPPLSLQEWIQGGSSGPSGKGVVGDDEFWTNDRLVFGPSPTREEVLRAISTIQRIFVPVTMQQVLDDGTPIRLGKDVVDDASNTPSTVDVSTREPLPLNTEPSAQLSETRIDHSRGVINAFRSLQVNPSIKKMVVSISSDKAVWDAVMKNDAVKEAKRSLFAVKSSKVKPGNTPDIVSMVVDWLLDCTKTVLLTFLDKIWMIAKEILQLNHGPDVGKKVQVFEEAVRSSFMISVVVFIVVVLFRVYQD